MVEKNKIKFDPESIAKYKNENLSPDKSKKEIPQVSPSLRGSSKGVVNASVKSKTSTKTAKK